MKQVNLQRGAHSEQGTLGRLEAPGLSMFSLELPWYDNAPYYSCVPCGQYICRPYSSAKYKDVYALDNVPGREAILIHIGNWAGDSRLGYITNSLGCILVGLAYGQGRGQLAVFNSATALRLLREFAGPEPFTLHISEGQR